MPHKFCGIRSIRQNIGVAVYNTTPWRCLEEAWYRTTRSSSGTRWWSSPHTPDSLSSGRQPRGNQLKGGWPGPRAGLDPVQTKRSSVPGGKWTPIPKSFSLQPSHYTEWPVPAQTVSWTSLYVFTSYTIIWTYCTVTLRGTDEREVKCKHLHSSPQVVVIYNKQTLIYSIITIAFVH